MLVGNDPFVFDGGPDAFGRHKVGDIEQERSQQPGTMATRPNGVVVSCPSGVGLGGNCHGGEFLI